MLFQSRGCEVLWLPVALLVILFADSANGARVIATVETANAGIPLYIMVDQQTSKVYFGNVLSNTVTVLDGLNKVSGIAIHSTTPGRPTAFALDSARSRVYVFNFDGGPHISVMDQNTNAATDFSDPPGNRMSAEAIAIVRTTGRIYLPSIGTGTVSVVDPVTRRFESVTAGTEPTYAVVNQTTGIVFVATRDSVVVMQGNSVVRTIPMPGLPRVPVIDEVANKIFVPIFGRTAITVIDGASYATTSLAAPVECGMIAVNSQTHKLYGSSSTSPMVAVIDESIGTSTTLSVPLPGFIAISESTNQVYVVKQNSNQIYIIDGATNAIDTLNLFPLRGLNLLVRNIAVNSRTNRIYVASELRFKWRGSTAMEQEHAGQIDVIDAGAAKVPTVKVDAIEAVQSVQDLAQSVPLIAGKPAVARVYLSGGSVAGVTAILTVHNSTGSDSPRELHPVRPIDVDGSDLRSRRDADSGSLDFTLPPDLAAESSLGIKELRNAGGLVPCSNCSSTSSDLVFTPPIDLKVKVVGLSYNASNPTRTLAPRQVDFQMLNSWLIRAYPISTLSWAVITVQAQAAVPFKCEAANAQILAIRNLDIQSGTDARTHYYGYVYDDGGNDGMYFMRGCSAGIPEEADPSIVASGPTGPQGLYVNFSWDTSPSWGGWYGAHELGHSYGRMHAGPFTGYSPEHRELGPCGEVGPDHSFPYAAGQISNSDDAFVGLDVGDTTNNINRSVMPGPEWHDVMSYCTNIWISKYNYMAVMQRLIAENALPATPPADDGSGVVARSAQRSAATAPNQDSALVPQAASHPLGDYVTVIGSANVTQRTGSLDYVHRVRRGETRAADASSPTRLRLLGSNDTVLQEIPTTFLRNSDRRPGEDLKGVVQASFIMRTDLKAIQLIVDSKVVARFDAASPIAVPQTEIRTMAKPGVQGAGAERAQHSRKTLRIEWGAGIAMTANSVRYDVQASSDGGKTWQTLAISRPVPNADIDVTGFDKSTTVLIRVLANSGFESKVIAQRSLQ